MPLRVDGVRLADSPATPAAEVQERRHALGHPGAGTSPFSHLLRRLGSELDRGEALVTGTTRAGYGTMDAGTLIALQAGIYRYSEALDLTVKLVDRVASATKTILEAGR